MTKRKTEIPALQFLKTVFSALVGLFLIWVLVYGKDKLIVYLAPYLEKIPRNQTALGRLTDRVLGSTIDNIKNETDRNQIITTSSKAFESSSYTEPARELRDDLKGRVDDAVISLKALPAQEVQTIKKQLCNEWFPSDASSSASSN